MSLVNLTNYRDHPTNPSYVVFFFHNKEVADTFEELLLINMIDFERAVDDDDIVERYLFGVRKLEFTQAEKLNYQAIGKHRKGFIPNRFFKFFVLIFTLAVLLLALIGAYKAGF